MDTIRQQPAWDDEEIAPGDRGGLETFAFHSHGPSAHGLSPRGFNPHELWPLPARLARDKLGLPQQQFLVLHLGRIVPGKGLDVGIRSLALLRSRHGVDAALVIVGGGPPEAPEAPELARLRSLAAHLGLGAHVHIEGRAGRTLLRYYYGAADAFVTLPEYEPFGTTAIEAMACARPVVGADRGRLKSIIIDGETGLLIPPRDPETLSLHLHALAAYPALAARMGEHGMCRAHRYFNWRALAQRLGGSDPKAAPAHGPLVGMQVAQWP